MDKLPATANVSVEQVPYCQWTITISNCIESSFFRLVYIASAYVSTFVFLSAVWLLAWRLCRNPGSPPAFSISRFLSIDGFLFTQIFWGASRVAYSVILIYNVLEDAWIERQILNDVSWLVGCMSVATYLAGILRTIPRMYFYRQRPHYSHATHLPNLRAITVVYFFYVGLLSAIVITCSAFVGYLRMQSPTADVHQYINTAMAIQYSTYSVSCLVVAIGYIIYGRKLVRITSEGFELLRVVGRYHTTRMHSVDEERDSSGASDVDSEIKSKKRKLQRTVWKMRFIHLAFIFSFAVMAVSLAAFAFAHEKIFSNIVISKISAATALWMPLILNVCILVSIAYGKTTSSKRSSVTYHTTNGSSVHPERLSRQRLSTHSRNTSTGSQAPLLPNSPPPIAAIPIARVPSQSASDLGSVSPGSPLPQSPPPRFPSLASPRPAATPRSPASPRTPTSPTSKPIASPLPRSPLSPPGSPPARIPSSPRSPPPLRLASTSPKMLPSSPRVPPVSSRMSPVSPSPRLTASTGSPRHPPRSPPLAVPAAPSSTSIIILPPTASHSDIALHTGSDRESTSSTDAGDGDRTEGGSAGDDGANDGRTDDRSEGYDTENFI